MAYYLRSRVRDALLEPNEEEDFGGSESESEDNVSNQSESDSEESECSEEEDLEDATRYQRVLEQSEEARGRPRTILLGKDNTKWSSSRRERMSGNYNMYFIGKISGSHFYLRSIYILL